MFVCFVVIVVVVDVAVVVVVVVVLVLVLVLILLGGAIFGIISLFNIGENACIQN